MNILSQTVRACYMFDLPIQVLEGSEPHLRQPPSLGGGPGMRPRPGKALRRSKMVKSNQHSTEAETLWWCSCSNRPDVDQNSPWPGKWSQCWVEGPGGSQPWKPSYSCFPKTGMGRDRAGCLWELSRKPTPGSSSLPRWYNNPWIPAHLASVKTEWETETREKAFSCLVSLAKYQMLSIMLCQQCRTKLFPYSKQWREADIE